MGTWAGRLRFAVRRAVTWPLRAGFERLTRRRSYRVQIAGLDVYIDPDSGDESDAHAAAGRMEEAFELLREIDPRGLASLRRQVSRVYIEPAASSSYFAASNAIGLSWRLVHRHDVETIAGVLVHEATHARIEHAGIKAWPDLLPRIERRCLLEQIAFLEKVPGREDLVAHYRAQLERPWWTSQERFDRVIRHFDEIGAPRWFLKAYRFIAGRRTT